MLRRLLSLTLALVFALGIPAAFAETGIGSAAYYDPSYPVITSSPMIMYVYTDNGQGLNVRRTPFVGNNIIGLAEYGSEVHVIRFLDNGWACIEWPRYTEAYVQSRFLQWYQPLPYISPTPAPTAVPVPTAAPTASPYSYTDTLAVLNAEFRTARLVTPFTVVVRPSRASGWVNMRWAPSKDTEVISTYRSGAQLTVIAETQSWYQVVDQSTEATGFMMKTYVTRQY